MPSPESRVRLGVRMIVVIMALRGLVPGLGAVATDYADVLAAGEPTVAVTCDRGDGHSSSEHGCGVTLHLCGCCASETVLISAASIVRPLHPVSKVMLSAERQLAQREPDRPFRPPIC